MVPAGTLASVLQCALQPHSPGRPAAVLICVPTLQAHCQAHCNTGCHCCGNPAWNRALSPAGMSMASTGKTAAVWNVISTPQISLQARWRAHCSSPRSGCPAVEGQSRWRQVGRPTGGSGVCHCRAALRGGAGAGAGRIEGCIPTGRQWAGSCRRSGAAEQVMGQ